MGGWMGIQAVYSNQKCCRSFQVEIIMSCLNMQRICLMCMQRENIATIFKNKCQPLLIICQI